MTQLSPPLDASTLPVDDTPDQVLKRPADNSPIAVPMPVAGQAGDMHFGAQVTDQQGLDAFQAAALKDQQRAATPDAATPVQSGSEADKLIAAAKTQIGVPYVYGAHEWGKALDCSGFTQQAMAQIGIHIGGDTYTQVTQGQAVNGGIGNAKPGDLLFTTGDIGMRANGHVAIYIGNGWVLAAPHTGAKVEPQNWSSRPLTAIRRYF